MSENLATLRGCVHLPDLGCWSRLMPCQFMLPGLAAGLLLCAASLPVYADEPEENSGTEEITVTGSFIKQDANDTSMQVVTMDRSMLELQGSPSMVDLFKNLSASHGILGENSSWYGTGQNLAESVSNVNLRGLGASRTLVLINGRRQVYVPARLVSGRFVDVNAIPQVAIERIDVLKEGAAAIYGSDAMGGVVNFHTRKDFDGFELSASHDSFENAGDSTIAGIWGVDVGENAHLMVAAEHYRRQELKAGEREWGLREFAGRLNGWSSVGNPGTFYRLRDDGETRVVADLNVEGFNDPRCEGFGGYESGESGDDLDDVTCRFRYSQFDNLIEKQDHTRIFAELNGEFETGMAYHLEAMYSEADIPEWRNTPSYPPAAWANIDEVNLIDMNHPAYGTLVRTFGANDERNPYGFKGRTVGHSGPARFLKRESETWRLSASVNDEISLFGDNLYEYDVGFSYSHSEGTVGQPAEYITRRFLAYRGFGGPNCGVEALPDRGKKSGLRLGDTTGKSPGEGDCMYYNPYSDALQYSEQPGAEFVTRPNPYYDETQANSRELLDWMVGSEVSLDSEADLYVFDLTLTGDVGEDMGSFAAGYQFRRFEAEATPNRPGDLSINPCRVNKDQAPSASDEDLDCAEQNKNLNDEGNPLKFTDGQIGTFGFTVGNFPYSRHQTTHSFFGEWAYDISDTMNMQLAAHYEEHDESSTFDPKAAVLWDVSDSITLRGSVQTTFRAPSVDDLNEDPFYRQEWVDGAYKPIEVKGDKSLDPEEALTYNIGMFAELGNGVELTLDYWKYIFDDPITATPHGSIVTTYRDYWYPLQKNEEGNDEYAQDRIQEPATSNSPVDDLIVCAAGTGPTFENKPYCQIEAIRTQMINGPTIRTSGLDFNLGGSHDLQQGVFSWGLGGTYLLEYDVDALNFRGIPLRDRIEAAGYYNDPSDFDIPPLPRLKGHGFASYSSGDWTTSLYMNYISAYDDRLSSLYPDIDSFVTLDIGLRWEPPAGNTTLTLTVHNIADEDPPAVDWEVAHDNLTHDAKGRRFKLGFKYAFGG
ncbi:MAG: TonB-dependent receptor [Gammaproteobacteria bacterium]|nr:TonB-dependent receptor [Gammaproteobacteria bacterium]